MSHPKIKYDPFLRHRSFKRLAREGRALVTLLMQAGKLVEVFESRDLAARYMEENPANDYELVDKFVKV